MMRALSHYSYAIDHQDKEAEFILTDQDGRRPSKLKLMAKYIPVPVVLEPRESINSQYPLLSSS